MVVELKVMIVIIVMIVIRVMIVMIAVEGCFHQFNQFDLITEHQLSMINLKSVPTLG